MNELESPIEQLQRIHREITAHQLATKQPEKSWLARWGWDILTIAGYGAAIGLGWELGRTFLGALP